MAGENYTALVITRPREYVVQVELNRPEKRNAMTTALFREIGECFKKLNDDADCRVVVVSGAGKLFSAGIDLSTFAQSDSMAGVDKDIGRKAFKLRKSIADLQACFSVIEKCSKPVIAAIHSACVGGGVDLACWCDIRYCTKDAWFQIKEVDIGIAADVGTLQLIHKITGNSSLVRDLAFTARKLNAEEAKQMGFVSRILPDRASLLEAALDTASLIASKSPIAVQGTKISMVYSRDHTVAEGLDQIVTWNQCMGYSNDMVEAVQAQMTKRKANFSKL